MRNVFSPAVFPSSATPTESCIVILLKVFAQLVHIVATKLV